MASQEAVSAQPIVPSGFPRPYADRTRQLHALQCQALEAVAGGRPLAEVATLVCERVEQLAPSVVCSVLRVDENGRIRPLAGPSLPAGYSSAIDGVEIGPETGSCGTAAYLNAEVEVHDIATDRKWLPYNAMPLAAGLVACWSSPIRARDHQVIGTFAFYYRTHRGPDPFERELVAACVHVCALAIEHEAHRARIHQLAYYDPLTGLANRAFFQERVSEALEARAQVAVFVVNLDEFKTVNDALGHATGDLLLRGAAERLQTCARKGDLVARLGADEFAVLQHGVEGGAEVAALARRIVAALGAPFALADQQVTIGASIGVAVSPGEGSSAQDMMKRANLALAHAKRDGQSAFRFFTQEMAQRAEARLALGTDLRRALDHGGFELFYQPLVTLRTGRLTGFEALLRWSHPERGPISAIDLIRLAEENGLIVPLGAWVLRDACRRAMTWPNPVRVGVNISPLQLKGGDLVAAVDQALAESGLAPGRLELEITESVLLASDGTAKSALGALAERGVRLSLDDFGTGYASLSYLRTFPFHKIKIDRSFILELPHDRFCLAIVRAALALARDLGMETTAEGVETAEQLWCLRTEGCLEVQGYHLGRPAPADRLAGLFDPDAFRAALD